MKSSILKKTLCLLTAGVILTPVQVFASETEPVRNTDVTLADGQLTGSVLSADAQPVAGETVQVMHGSKVVATTVSNADGAFAVRGLRQGQHALVINGEQRPVRFWEANNAPPASVERVSLVKNEENIVRANDDDRRLAGGLLAIGVFGGVVATTLYYTLEENGADTPASP